MIKIRAMGARELRQVLNLLERFRSNNPEMAELNAPLPELPILENFRQLYVPVHLFSQFLPPHWQFVPAIYVAVSENKVLGLIWLSQDGKSKHRWQIDQLIIDPDEFSYDVGTQLVNFAINHYGAGGIQTFLAFVDTNSEQALALLKACGFRHAAKRQYFYLSNPGELKLEVPMVKGLREAGRGDRKKLKSLYNDCLTPETRLSLQKTAADFNRPLSREFSQGGSALFKRWVVEDPARGLLLASVEIVTGNYRDFHLDLSVSPGWQDHYEGLLAFGIRQVLKTTSEAKIMTSTFDFYKNEVPVLEKAGFSRIGDNEILVKDYWVPLKDDAQKLTSPILLFDGKTSPACIQSLR